MLKFFRFLNEIGKPPWNYYFLQNLDESEYPKYLAEIFKYRTGENLPLHFSFIKNTMKINKKRCETFNQKIQWLKLYDNTPLKRELTDKIKAREYLKEKTGEEYFKPILQICNSFDETDFSKLPDSFVMKTNHGCKWQYIIKNKKEFLNTPKLFEIVKRQMTGWLEQDYSFWCGFEMNYRGIEPKIIIEPLMREYINKDQTKINIYFFNGIPKIIIKFFDNKMSIWDEKFDSMDNIFNFSEENIKMNTDDLINQTFDLSIKTEKFLNFELVRTDWMIYKNKPYFEELTFSPYSGFINFKDKNINKRLGSWLNLERLNYEFG